MAEIGHEIPGGSSLPSGAWTTSAWPPHLHPRGMPGWPPRVYRTKEQQVSGHHPLPPQTGAQRKLADGARTQPGKRLRPSREGCPAVPLGAHTTPHKGGSRHRRTCGAGAPETERGRAGVLCGHRTRPHAGGSVRPAGEGNAEPASAQVPLRCLVTATHLFQHHLASPTVGWPLGTQTCHHSFLEKTKTNKKPSHFSAPNHCRLSWGRTAVSRVSASSPPSPAPLVWAAPVHLTCSAHSHDDLRLPDPPSASPRLTGWPRRSCLPPQPCPLPGLASLLPCWALSLLEDLQISEARGLPPMSTSTPTASGASHRSSRLPRCTSRPPVPTLVSNGQPDSDAWTSKGHLKLNAPEIKSFIPPSRQTFLPPRSHLHPRVH